MWAKILGMLVVAIGLGSVGAYYAHHDDAGGCPLSGGGCPLSTGCSTTSGCPSSAPAPTCCEDEQLTTVTGTAPETKCPLCEGK